MKFDCAQKGLEKLFYKYGMLVGKKPLPFLLCPILITLLATTGFARFAFLTDSEYLYTPKNGEAKNERQFFVDVFHEDQDEQFSAYRKNTADGTLHVMIAQSENGGNVLTEEVLQYAIDVDAQIKARTISYNGETLTFDDLCARWNTSCAPNVLPEALDYKAENVNLLNITYPFYGYTFLGHTLGDVTVNEDGLATGAESIIMSYFTTCVSEEDAIKGNMWMTEVKEYLLTIDDGKLYFFTSLSFDEELESNYISLIPNFVVAFVILLVFCVLSCMTSDWVYSKPWVAVAGEASAFMAVVTTCGFLLVCGLELFVAVGVMPFIVLGIGVDDMFVMLSSWRQTSSSQSVEERMAQMMSTAAVSITITSLTDTLAFTFGSLSPLPSIVHFSAYTAMAVVFSYFYAITFLAASIVYSGRREANGLHVISCLRAVPKNEASDRSVLFRWFCTGGTNKEKDQSTDDKQNNPVQMSFVARFFKEIYTPFILKLPVKTCVICVYVIYLAIGIWGCTSLTDELQLEELAPPDSYLTKYIRRTKASFGDSYGPKLMFAFDQTIDYSNTNNRDDVLATLEDITNLDYFLSSPSMTESWLRDYTNYLEDTGQSPQNMTHFIAILTSEFLNLPQYQIYKLDVNLNTEQTEITSSRFLLQTYGVSATSDEKKLMTQSREFAKQSPYELVVYHNTFIFTDQYTVIMSSTFQNIGLAVASIFIVSIVLLSNIVAIVWVTLSVISIFIGVIGYLVLWGGTLNYLTSMYLAMCVGFSVDFSVHICYHFVHCTEKDITRKTEQCLAYLGHPITQGTLSTILAVIVLASSSEYIFLTFFKVVFIVMVFGFVHGVLFIPMMLAIATGAGNEIQCCTVTKKKTKSKERIHDTDIGPEVSADVKEGWI